MTEVERRFLAEGLEVRGGKDGGGRTLTGYAAVFDSRSENLGHFVEVIKPGAFDRAMKEGHDVRALVNHDSGMILGRTTSGTLRLSVDERGLRYEVDLPDTTAGRDIAESVRRGDINGSSFGFRVAKGGEAWSKGDDKVALRSVTDLELLDVSPVTYPAYSATQVSFRALERAKEETEEVIPEPVPEPPMDRLRLKWEIGKTEEAEKKRKPHERSLQVHDSRDILRGVK